MEELIAELKKLGATVTRDVFGYMSVNDQRITVEVKVKDNKSRYEVGIGGKRCASPKNAAYHILTEYLPDLKRLHDLRDMMEKVRTDLPTDARVYMMHDGELRIQCRTAEQLKRILKHMAEHCE